MTRVDFYFNVIDKPKKIIELTQLAVNKQRRVMVYAVDETQAKDLSDKLWSDVPTSFIPHIMVGTHKAETALINFAPILILTAFGNGQALHLHEDDVLINLQAQHPNFFSRFRLLIELVGSDEVDKVAARNRYKFYRDRGYAIKSIDTGVRESSN